MKLSKTIAIGITLILVGCAGAGSTPGPDKMFEGELSGAVVGAGAGAVTGFQVGAGTGPGAAVGAGFGAVAGAVQGFARDQMEENLMKLAAETRAERRRAIVHEILNDHYARRMELHPTRDIYPADLFFYGDEAKMRQCAIPLVQEIARMNKERLPWSRLAVAVYSKASEPNSDFAAHLSEMRAREITNYLISGGIEPRRIETRATVVDAPVLIDPNDYPGRYNQAVELIPLDR